MIVGGYTLDLYCDSRKSKHWTGTNGYYVDDESVAHQFTGRTYSECARKAKKFGWKISKDNKKATCPMCAKKPDTGAKGGEG